MGRESGPNTLYQRLAISAAAVGHFRREAARLPVLVSPVPHGFAITAVTRSRAIARLVVSFVDPMTRRPDDPIACESPAVFIRPGFRWSAADAYLFDIDGTLLNSRDPVHYFAFQHALQDVFGLQAKIDGVPVHGNTDVGILRAVLRRQGVPDAEIDARLPQMIGQMCAEVQRHAGQMRPELCPSVYELVSWLHGQGKLLGAASGNVGPIGWLKLEKAGLKPMFSFGAFCFPLEFRADIFRQGMDLARERLGSQATVYVVGDTPADILAAKAVGASVIAVATGIFKFEDLVVLEPDACFACGTDMLNV